MYASTKTATPNPLFYEERYIGT